MLTDAQRKAREGKLTASRVGVLMRGDAEAVMQLWLELSGQAPEKDLSNIWAVRLGETTEQLHLDWLQETLGYVITRRGEVVTHNDYPWAACTLDGWHDGMPIEAKHCNGHEPVEVIIERYQPQVQWTMFVTRAREAAITIIQGAREPNNGSKPNFVDRDDAYIEEMVRRSRQFMFFVRCGEPPVVLPPVPAPINAQREIDMTGNETWKRQAEQWLQVHGAAEVARDCEKVLKKLVPDDARKASGHGIRITRDRAGRLSLRAEE